MAGLGDPHAVELARILMTHQKRQPHHRIGGFTATCEELPLAVVLGTWMSLKEHERNDPLFLTPLARRLTDQKLYAMCASLLLHRNDLSLHSSLRLEAARLLLTSDRPEDFERAQFEISDLVQRSDSAALAGFRLLEGVNSTKFISAYFPELDEWVASQPGATAADHLLATNQLLNRLPQHGATIIDQAVARYVTTDPLAVARWLARLGQHERALALLPATSSAQQLEPFRARAEILACLSRWDELATWLANPPVEFPAVELRARRVVAADRRNDTATRTREWEQALRDATATAGRNALLELHRAMQQAGLDELAREAMVEAVCLGRGRLPIFAQVEDLVPWLRQRQRGFKLMEFCRVMARLEPHNPIPNAIALDLGCVTGAISPKSSAKVLQQIVKKNPDLTAAREWLATAILLDGRPEQALATLSSATVTDPAASPRALVVAATARLMLGRSDGLTDLLDRVPWDAMLPEERDCFLRELARIRLGDAAEQAKIQHLIETHSVAPDERVFERLDKRERERRQQVQDALGRPPAEPPGGE
jgi:hypothetical protein